MFNIVAVHQSVVLALLWPNAIQGKGQAAASPMCILASAPLHASPCLEARESVCGYAILFGSFAIQQSVAVRITARKVEEVDAGEDDEEAAEEGESVDSVGSIKAAEEDEGRAECSCGESDIV